MNKCKDCIDFFKCVSVSAEIAGIKNTPEEIDKCMEIPACNKFNKGSTLLRDSLTIKK